MKDSYGTYDGRIPEPPYKQSSAGDATTQEPVDHAPRAAGPDAQTTPRTDREEYTVKEADIGFKVVNPAPFLLRTK